MAHRAARDQALSATLSPTTTFVPASGNWPSGVHKAACTGTAYGAKRLRHRQDAWHLFPQLKAFPGQRLDKLFFLAAKTSVGRLALDALQTLQRNAN